MGPRDTVVEEEVAILLKGFYCCFGVHDIGCRCSHVPPNVWEKSSQMACGTTNVSSRLPAFPDDMQFQLVGQLDRVQDLLDSNDFTCIKYFQVDPESELPIAFFLFTSRSDSGYCTIPVTIHQTFTSGGMPFIQIIVSLFER